MATASPSAGGGAGPVALALSGGAAYGLAHIGVIRALERAGLCRAAVAGTSMGALVGAFYAAGRLDALADWAGGLGRRWWARFADPTLTGSGLIAGRRIVRTLSDHLGGIAIEDLPVPYAAVAVDLRTGRALSVTSGPLAVAVRASIAVPGLMAGVERAGAFLVDGGLLDPLPVDAARALGPARVIAVNLHADQPGEALAAGLINRDALGRTRRVRPGPAAVSAAAHGIMLRRITEANLRDAPPDLMICPRMAHLGLTAYHRAAAFIEAGERAGEAALAEADPGLRASLGLTG